MRFTTSDNLIHALSAFKTKLDSTYAAKSHGTHLTLGTTSSTAYRGDLGNVAYAHSQASHAPSNAQKNSDITKAEIEKKLTGTITSHNHDGTYAAKSHGTHLTIGTGASNAAAGNHNHTQLTGEVKFPGSGTYSDPWNGTECAIKATGNIGCSGSLRANSGIATCAGPNGVATADGSKYVALFSYRQDRGICDLGNNGIPGRLYIRSGQGTAGSGVYIENKVTDGRAYMQYLSPEAGTIALTSHLSDRTRKDNIVYTNDEKSNFSNNDFYNFIKDDLDLATYTLKENYAATDTHTKLNFIAQDILWDFNRNEENKVGNLIVQAEAAMESQYSLKYDADNFIAVIAGALKEAINEIELLKSENEELIERLLRIELSEGGEQ